MSYIFAVDTLSNNIILQNNVLNIDNINSFEHQYSRFIGFLGYIFILLISIFLSDNRKYISIKLVCFGLFMQFGFAFIVLKSSIGNKFFNIANAIIIKLLSFANNGSKLLFGNLIYNIIPIHESLSINISAFFAFSVLPTIIFFAALTAVLYHVRILEYIVMGIAFIMKKTLKTSGAESFSAAANIFVGQTEAPLVIRPFLKNMTNSEIMTVMTGGFATAAGGVMAAYVGILNNYFPDIGGHLLAASVMAAPGSITISKIIVPETCYKKISSSKDVVLQKTSSNILDAAAKGTSDGLYLALNVGAMLIAFTALIAFLNYIISYIATLCGFQDFSLEVFLGYIFSPLAFLMGVP